MSSKASPQLSIIVPALNESAFMPELFASLGTQVGVDFELIVCDGGSCDGSADSARAMGRDVPFSCTVIESERGRGRQMNAGAAEARSETLLFLHADSRFTDPGALLRALQTLETAVVRRGDDSVAARFALRFRRSEATPSLPYYISEAKARLNRPGCIHGDQGFLLRRTFFLRVGPFDESLPFLEDAQMSRNVFREGEWVLIPSEIETSARRFEIEGLYERHTLNALIMNFFHIDERDLLAAMPGIYCHRKPSARLDLFPFFEEIHRHLRSLSPRKRLRLWYRTGSFVRENAWQLPFACDQRVHFRRGHPVGAGKNHRLRCFERYVAPLTDNVVGRLIAAILTRIWFSTMLKRLRRIEKRADLAAGKEQ